MLKTANLITTNVKRIYNPVQHTYKPKHEKRTENLMKIQKIQSKMSLETKERIPNQNQPNLKRFITYKTNKNAFSTTHSTIQVYQHCTLHRIVLATLTTYWESEHHFLG